MPTLKGRCTALVKSCTIAALVLGGPFVAGAVPARAQDFFGLFRVFAPPPQAPAPAPAPALNFRVGPSIKRVAPKERPAPKPASLEQLAVNKSPLEPKPLGKIDNPVPALLADSTLRPGDMVMFPDGLRVFAGKPGGQHKLDDFKPISKAGKVVSRSTRKLAASLTPSENMAWNTESVRSAGKLAANTGKVETTGSVKRRSR
jgi:hypothetical protein